MSKNNRVQTPLSIRPKKDVMDKIRKIAEANSLPISTVANMCLAGGLTIVAGKLEEIHTPAKN
jgi:hypothetical protein